jgi:hypothetical protein
MATGLENFQLARFQLRLRMTEAVDLPEHMGSTLRGGFGRIFRRVACRLGCGEACQQPKQCAYGYVFETSPPPGSRILDKVESAPRPFVIEPPLAAKQVYEKGEELLFGLILVGRAVDALPYFVYSFEELGRVGIGRGKGKFRLVQVAAVPVGDDRVATKRHSTALRPMGSRDGSRWCLIWRPRASR